MEEFINYNGKLIVSGIPVLTADNRGFRYGDGVFETMKLSSGQVQLKEYHFDRLFDGIAALQLDWPALFTRAFLEEQILATCLKNKLTGQARVRLAVFRGEGGLYETDGPGGGFIIQTWPLPGAAATLNDNGLVIGIYTEARKSCDSLANLKSANYLVYVMAALYAKEQRYNDCLALNEYHRICDASIANIFWIKDNIIYTPPLSEGCVAGVMRRWLLQQLKASGYTALEKPAEKEELEKADELFLTNAISGIRWVRSLGNIVYGNALTVQLYARFFGAQVMR